MAYGVDLWSQVRDEVNMYAEEAVLGASNELTTVEQWTIDPWADVFRVDDLIQDFLDLDDEMRDAVMDELSESRILPNYPTVRVDVEEN